MTHLPQFSHDDSPAAFGTRIRRRSFLRLTAAGLGSVALGSLMNSQLLAAPASGRWPGVIQPTHFPAKAKRVIWLTMAGGPSHLETFDHKPVLAEMHGKPMPESMTKGQQLAQLQGAKLVCFGPQLKFKKFDTGAEICGLFEQTAAVANEICFVRSMTTEAINHDPAHMFFNTGSQIAGRPSMGAWAV